MKLIVAVEVSSEVADLFAQDKVLCAAGWSRDLYWWGVDSRSPLLERILDVTQQIGTGFRLRGELSKSEWDTVGLYKLQATKSGLALSSADERANVKYIASLAYLHRGGGCGIRVMERFYLSRVRVRPNANSMYPAFDAWMATVDVCDALMASGISGLAYGPVLHPATNQAYEQVRLLVPTNVLDPCISDQSVMPHTPHPDGISFHKTTGFVSYSPSVISSAQDFNCSCEAIGSFGLGATIVSRRFRETVGQHKIKGIDFAPVLDSSTSLYAAYHAEHSRVMAMIQANPLNRG